MRESKPSGADISAIKEKANSPAGQQLLSIFEKNNSPELKAALEKAASGDYSSAKNIIQSILSTPEASDLLEQLRRD